LQRETGGRVWWRHRGGKKVVQKKEHGDGEDFAEVGKVALWDGERNYPLIQSRQESLGG